MKILIINKNYGKGSGSRTSDISILATEKLVKIKGSLIEFFWFSINELTLRKDSVSLIFLKLCINLLPL